MRRIAILALLLLLSGCGRQETPFAELPKVSGKTVWSYAEKSVSFGERHAGSKAIRDYGNWIMQTASASRKCKVYEHTFTEKTPRGEIAFRNIIAEIPGKSRKFILVGAHYDTKRFSFIRNFQGANDGASGVAVLLGMIDALGKYRGTLPCSFRFVFFDGEECMINYGPEDGLHGSRRLAQDWEASGELRQCIAMVLLDMVGDRDLQLTIPSGCSRSLTEQLLRIASENGCADKVRVYEQDMIDDHVPFLKRGIPSIDLIDFEYGPGNAFWHTAEDTLDKISAESMKTAGDLAFALCWKIAE